MRRLRPTATSTLVAVGVFTLLTLALNLRILATEGIPVHGDLTYPLQIEKYSDNYRYVFNDAGSVSNFESIDRAPVLFPLTGLAQLLGQGTAFVHRFVFLIIPLISLVTMYALLRYVLARTRPSYLRPAVLLPASILFGLSPWVMEQIPAYLFWLAYALTPLLLLLAFRFFEQPSWRAAWGLAFVLTLVASTPHYFIYSLAVIAVIGVLEIILRLRSNQSAVSIVAELGSPLIVLMLVAVGLNFFWLYPTVRLLADGHSVNPGYQVTPAMTRMFSTHSSALNVMRGFDQWVYWYQNDSRMGFMFNRFWVLNSLVVPLIAFGGLLLPEARQSRHVRTLAFLACAFGFLALGTTTPFYDWLVFRAPFLRDIGWIFRVPGKLSYFLWPFYAVMVALVLGKLFESKLRAPLRVSIFVAVILSLAALLIPKPLFYFYDYYVPVQVPYDYVQLDRFLSRLHGDFRVLYLAPYDGSFGSNKLAFETSYTWNPRRLASATPAIWSSKPSIGYYHLTYRDWQFTLYPRIYPNIPSDLGRRFLANAGVAFVVYHNDIVGGTSQGKDDLRRLRRSDLRLAARFGDVYVFRNPFAHPVVRAFGGLPGVLVNKQDATHYSVSLPEDGSVRRLFMGQPYDPLWILRAGGATIAPTELKPYGMAFDLPASTPSTVSVEYYPQRFYHQGLLISSLAFLVTASAAIWRSQPIRHMVARSRRRLPAFRL